MQNGLYFTYYSILAGYQQTSPCRATLAQSSRSIAYFVRTTSFSSSVMLTACGRALR